MKEVYNNWKLSVSGYGKIDKAEIELSPMTVFVGDNNSGKSYLMTLIYGLLTMPANVMFGNINFNTKLAVEVRDIIVNCEDGIHKLSDSEIGLISRLLNEQLNTNKKKIMSYLFNRDVSIETISIELSPDMIYSFKKESLEVFEGDQACIVSPIWSGGKSILGYPYRINNLSDDSMERVICAVMQCMLRKTINEINHDGNAIYLPSARTGFMLTYRDLIGNALNDKYSDYSDEQFHGIKGSLTRPNIDFINSLAQITVDDEQDGNKAIVDFIEKRITTGKIIAKKSPMMSVEYVPYGYSDSMPLYITSAVVTEIAPLLLFLRFTKPSSIFYEEPETSLHPALQKEIARAFIKLINSGIPLFVTTHSDIIIQHINNMLKIDNANNKHDIVTSLEYDADDVLSKDKVRVYQFESDEKQHSYVHSINCGKYGFEVMTFYDTFVSMSKEIDVIEGDE